MKFPRIPSVQTSAQLPLRLERAQRYVISLVKILTVDQLRLHIILSTKTGLHLHKFIDPADAMINFIS